jgi:hypothetical protein
MAAVMPAPIIAPRPKNAKSKAITFLNGATTWPSQCGGNSLDFMMYLHQTT